MKKILWPKFGPSELKSGLKSVFLSFSEVCSLVFLKIEYKDSLQHYLTPSIGKTHEKNLGAQIWTKIGLEIRFSAFFSSVVISFPLNYIG